MDFKRITTAALLLSALLAVSCQQADPEPKPGTDRIRFNNIKGSFAQGTKFGLYVGSPVNKENVLLTVNAEGKLESAEELYWGAGQKSASSFLCYTPYDSTYVQGDVTFCVKEDQSVAANVTASDLLCSVTSAAPADEAVNFDFKHKMATAKLYFDNRLNKKISSVVVNEIYTSCQFSLSSGEAKTPSNKKNVSCYDAGDFWQVVFVPQSAKLTLSITMEGGEVIVKEASKETVFTSGYEYSTSESPIVLGEDTAKQIVLNFSVSDWADGGQLNFNGEEEEFTTLAELAATAGATSTSFSGVTVKNVVVTKVSNKYAHIEDATAAILVYNNSHGLAEGDCINGELSGTIVLYDGNKTLTDKDKAYAELTAINCSKATVTKVTEEAYPLTVITVEEYNKNYRTYFNRRVEFKGVTITSGISSSTVDGKISQGSSTLNIFNKAYSAELKTGLYGDLICFPTANKSTLQALIYTSDQFTEGGGEDTAFTKLTVMGSYSATDTDSPVAVRTYTEGSDQFSCSKSSEGRTYRMFNLETGKYLMLDLASASIVSGTEITATAIVDGTATTHTLKVAKKTSTNAWLDDKTNKVGYVIAIQQ